MILISVILPSYNREATIKRAIESVLKQTFADIELIVVDDGSTDHTKDVVQSIEDSRIRYIYQDNAGACVARNTGIKAAKGEFIAFQDSDDSWNEYKLEKQYNLLQKTQADIVFCQVRRYGYNTADIIYPLLEQEIVEEKFLIETSLASTQTLLCKAEVFETEMFDPEMPRFQDYDLVIRLAQKYTFAFCREPLVDLYLQGDSITLNRDKTIIAHRKLIDKHECLWERYPGVLTWQLNALGNLEAAKKINNGKSFYRAFKVSKKYKYLLKYFLAKIGVLK